MTYSDCWEKNDLVLVIFLFQRWISIVSRYFYFSLASTVSRIPLNLSVVVGARTWGSSTGGGRYVCGGGTRTSGSSAGGGGRYVWGGGRRTSGSSAGGGGRYVCAGAGFRTSGRDLVFYVKCFFCWSRKCSKIGLLSSSRSGGHGPRGVVGTPVWVVTLDKSLLKDKTVAKKRGLFEIQMLIVKLKRRFLIRHD